MELLVGSCVSDYLANNAATLKLSSNLISAIDLIARLITISMFDCRLSLNSVAFYSI